MTTRNAASMGNSGSSWQANGYAGVGNVQELLGTIKGRIAIVVGSGDGVFYQLKRLLDKLEGQEPVIFAVNDIGMFLPKIDHWVSLHGKNLGSWKQVRWLHPREREFTKYHSVEEYPYTDYNWANLTPCFALSGYFAMQIAYIMDAAQLLLCGCPGDNTRRFFDIPDSRRESGTFSYDREGVQQQVIHEMQRLPDFKMRVRSTSGWTREFFGSV